MKNYDKIVIHLEEELMKARSDAELMNDKLCVVRLEERAMHFLVDSEINNLGLSLSVLINIFVNEFPRLDWNECIEILKKRKPEWW